jgi:hypothetical protein
VTIASPLPILRAARDRLVDAGFVTDAGPIGESRLDICLEFRRGSCRVLLGVERDQLFVTVGAAAGGPDHDIGLWEAYLDGNDPSTEDRDLSRDVDTIVRRYRDLERALADPSGDRVDRLRDAGRRRFFARRERGRSS